MKPSQTRSLLEFSLAMIEAEDSNDILSAILTGAMGLFEVEGAGIALLESDGALDFTFNTAKTNKVFRVPPGKGIAGWVVSRVTPVLSNDPQNDERFFNENQASFPIRNLMCAPLISNGKAIGVIEVLNTIQPDGFESSDMQLLELFAKMATAALAKNQQFQAISNASTAYREEDRRRNRLVGVQSQAMKDVMAMTRIAADSPSTVLLMSESGTGKELTARSIHRWSPRARGPFVAVNCVALTPELLASELFGHEKGAFTGAISRKIGKFELADGGAIFLDEIGELGPDLQSRLLRVLQEREFQRVGGNVNISVDVRIIAATNRNLMNEVQEGRFREDLYYRLNVITISLPPLRERKEDIPELLQFFTSRFCRDIGRPLMQFTEGAKKALIEYDWPGNVRQLQNTVERAVVLTRGTEISSRVLPTEIVARPLALEHWEESPQSRRSLDEGLPLREALERFKTQQILRALAAVDGNQARAAQRLGLQASNLSRLIKKLGLKPQPGKWWLAET